MTLCCNRPMRVVASTVLVKVEYCFACGRRTVTDNRKAGQRPFAESKKRGVK